MARKLRIAVSVFLGVLTAALAVACGIGAFVAAMTFFISLGLKYHDNYEYYGSTPAVCVVYLAGAMGFATPPGLVAFWLYKNRVYSPRFSVRSLLIATTLLSVVLGLAGWAGRSVFN